MEKFVKNNEKNPYFCNNLRSLNQLIFTNSSKSIPTTHIFTIIFYQTHVMNK